MKNLTIHAASSTSAQEMLEALSDFPAELVQYDGSCAVVVDLSGDSQIVGVLNALQHYVTERAAGAAHVEFNGTNYAMEPQPEAEPGGL